MTVTVILILGASAAAFGLSFAQAKINARHGTDHAVHSFLIDCIRGNGGRGFVRIPRLINEAYIGALPLYLHWIFARFSNRTMRVAEVILNPAVNAIHTCADGGVAFFVARELDASDMFAGVAALLFAFTPQFYHALSARNFGLSARSLGLIFLSCVFFFTWLSGQSDAGWIAWAMLIFSCFLVIAFSTFGLQVLVLVGAVLTILGYWQIALGAFGGVVLFLIVHPRYSVGYLVNTARFIAAYSQELAPRYVLARRFSIWRDLYRDIWTKFRNEGFKAGFRYAYENSFLILAGLNPLTLLAATGYLAFNPFADGSLLDFAGAVALGGVAIMLLTSVRPLRFLGEPERYVESVTPFAVLFATGLLYSLAIEATIAVIALFSVLCLAQVQASRILARYLSQKPLSLDNVQALITAEQEEVRLASNNEQYIKLMLINPWVFSYCIAVGHGYCGMKIAEAFDPFPYLTREALQRIVEEYRINYCILDRQRFDTIFDERPRALTGHDILLETEGIRLVRLEWRNDATIVFR